MFHFSCHATYPGLFLFSHVCVVRFPLGMDCFILQNSSIMYSVYFTVNAPIPAVSFLFDRGCWSALCRIFSRIEPMRNSTKALKKCETKRQCWVRSSRTRSSRWDSKGPSLLFRWHGDMATGQGCDKTNIEKKRQSSCWRKNQKKTNEQKSRACWPSDAPKHLKWGTLSDVNGMAWLIHG